MNGMEMVYEPGQALGARIRVYASSTQLSALGSGPTAPLPGPVYLICHLASGASYGLRNLAAKEWQLLSLLPRHYIFRSVGSPEGWMTLLHGPALACRQWVVHLWCRLS